MLQVHREDAGRRGGVKRDTCICAYAGESEVR